MRALSLILIVLLLTPGWAGRTRLDLLDAHIPFVATPVALFPEEPARRRLGTLIYLGGVSLTSRDPAFGGFSSMAVRGDRVTLLSDGGNLVGFRLGADWRVHDRHFGELPDGPRTGWEKADRDSESLVLDPAGRYAWVGFENLTSIWRYRADFSVADAVTMPAPMRRWPTNGGPEAMARLPDGSFLVLSESQERPPGDRGRAGLWFPGDPVAHPPGFGFTLVMPAGQEPTDAAALPDGRILVLTRGLGWRGFTGRLLVVARDAIRPGARVRPRELARFERPALTDNYEALAVTGEQGRTIVWIASDDNQSRWQRTLLLKFALVEANDKRRR